MDAQVVYQVVKALPKEEQQLLYTMLQSDLFCFKNATNRKKRISFSDKDAVEFLIKNVFRKDKLSQ